MKKKRCGACGLDCLVRIRAVIVRNEQKPRIGLVCKHCARCGMLVVPAALIVMAERPRKVSRSDFARSVLAKDRYET